MFDKILIEKDIQDQEAVQALLHRIPHKEQIIIDSFQDHFARSKKPYLQKRSTLNLYLAHKKGQLVKEAPDAYGTYGEPHFYYVHAYNCIYECNYCYLQGYFHSPDMVLFLNHNEIIAQMQATLLEHQELIQSGKRLWFHAGEFSDSLALTHFTQELEQYHQFFEQNPEAMWELRTKSVNIKSIEKLKALPNMVCSFSLSPSAVAKANDLKTPSTKARLKAIEKLLKQGHKIAIHLDPIILTQDFKAQYKELLQEIAQSIDVLKIEYISLGVVRFSSDVYAQVQRNYPETEYLHKEFITADDGKIKYPRPIRNWILSTVKQICLDQGIPEERIYLCMEM